MIGGWISENAWWLWPLAIGIGAQWEIRKLHRRIDAILALLHRRGIDTLQTDFEDL